MPESLKLGTPGSLTLAPPHPAPQPLPLPSSAVSGTRRLSLQRVCSAMLSPVHSDLVGLLGSTNPCAS